MRQVAGDGLPVDLHEAAAVLRPLPPHAAAVGGRGEAQLGVQPGRGGGGARGGGSDGSVYIHILGS